MCPLPVPKADTKRKVEEISEELKTLDTRLWSERDAQTPPQPPEGTPATRGDGTALCHLLVTLLVTPQPVSPPHLVPSVPCQPRRVMSWSRTRTQLFGSG